MTYKIQKVTVKRDPITGCVTSDIPHRCEEFKGSGVSYCHSPDGFEVNYYGSGPADFAFNILLAAGLSERAAWDLHQPFKRAFVAVMPHEGGTISSDMIKGFLNEYKEQIELARLADELNERLKEDTWK